MMSDQVLRALHDEARDELDNNIIPFWAERAADREQGGFYGGMNGHGERIPGADKGLILNARLLWTFSALHRAGSGSGLKQLADRAYRILENCFFDARHGGAYWMVDYQGNVVDRKKLIYGQAFTIYALAEYEHAGGPDSAGDKAVELFGLVDEKAHDPRYGGYFEIFERDWKLAGEQRLSEVDMDAGKSMNTHLHLLEACTGLQRVRPEARLHRRLDELLRLFVERIIDPIENRFRLFFDEQWRVLSTLISFGHDIEGSWLLCEAAGVHGNDELIGRIRQIALNMADAVLRYGVDQDGALFYEAEPHGITDTDKHWWPQAEAVVGFLNAYSLNNEPRFLEAAARTWRFITENLVDREGGEWFWSTSREGIADRSRPKISAWKSAYHNSRACLEIMARTKALLQYKR